MSLIARCVLLMATKEDYVRVVETFGYYNFCFERLVLIQKRTKYDYSTQASSKEDEISVYEN